MAEASPTSCTARDLFAPHEPITNTRDRIIVTALNRFYEHGFHAVGLDQILRDVGVTKTTFYNHFESKDELIIEAIRVRDRWETESFRRAVERFTDGTPRGTLLASFDALDQWFNHPQYEGCLFITACAEFPSPSDPIHQAAAAHYAKASTVFEDLCRKAGASDPATLARQIEMLLKGAVAVRMVTGDNTAARQAREMAEAMLERCGVIA